MNSSQNQPEFNDQGQELLKVLQFSCAPVLHGVLMTAIELNLFEIIAKAGPDAQLSPAEIASHLPTENHEAPLLLDRMLQVLASYSILKCIPVSDSEGHTTKLYGLNSLSKYLVPDEDGVSMAPPLLWDSNKAIRECWYSLKYAVLEGGIPFNKAHGITIFEYLAKSNSSNDLFNQMMQCSSAIFIREILKVYKGFEELKEVVDVGGGQGAILGAVVSKYPNIRGVNFDLPHVIESAPSYPGVEHVSGDMFQNVPEGEAIILKEVLHNWKDEDCLKLLKNCCDALPNAGGRVIVIEMILPESPETDLLSKITFLIDMTMFSLTSGGRQRTQKEYENLAIAAGFTSSKLVCHAHFYGILELYKN